MTNHPSSIQEDNLGVSRKRTRVTKGSTITSVIWLVFAAWMLMTSLYSTVMNSMFVGVSSEHGTGNYDAHNTIGIFVEGAVLSGSVIKSDISQAFSYWTPAGGPYFVFNQVKLLPGCSLTIQPQTIVYFLGSSSLTVSFGATLRAEATDTNSLIQFKSITGNWNVTSGLFTSVNGTIDIGNSTIITNNGTVVNGTGSSNDTVIYLGSSGYNINVEGVFYQPTTTGTCLPYNPIADISFKYCNFDGFDKIQLSGTTIFSNNFVQGNEFRVGVGSVLSSNTMTLTNLYSEATQSIFYQNTLRITSESSGVTNVAKGCWRENSYGQNSKNPLSFIVTHAYKNTFSTMNSLSLTATQTAYYNNFLNIGDVSLTTSGDTYGNVVSQSTTAVLAASGFVRNNVFTDVSTSVQLTVGSQASFNVFSTVAYLDITLGTNSSFNNNALYKINLLHFAPNNSTIVRNSFRMNNNFSITIEGNSTVDVTNNYWGTYLSNYIEWLRSTNPNNANWNISPFLMVDSFDYPFQISSYETNRYSGTPFLNQGTQCTNSCNGKGNCENAMCQCLPGYYGSACETPSCFGVVASDIACSSHGTCTALNNCSCSSGWMGSNCDIASCYGLIFNDSLVCNGHGTCNGSNQCVCNADWAGADCSYLAGMLYINTNATSTSFNVDEMDGIFYVAATLDSKTVNPPSTVFYTWTCLNCSSSSVYTTNNGMLMINVPAMTAGTYAFQVYGQSFSPSRSSSNVTIYVNVIAIEQVQILTNFDAFGLPSYVVKKNSSLLVNVIIGTATMLKSTSLAKIGCQSGCTLTYSWTLTVLNGADTVFITTDSGNTVVTLSSNIISFQPAITISTNIPTNTGSNVVLQLKLSTSATTRYLLGSITIPMVNSAQPRDGTLVIVSPQTGTALSQNFSINVQEWDAPSVLQPLTYAFGFYNLLTGKAVRVSEYVSGTSFSSILPCIISQKDNIVIAQDLPTVVFVKDSLGNVDQRVSTIAEVFPYEGNLDDIAAKIDYMTPSEVLVVSFDQSYKVSTFKSSAIVNQIVKNVNINATNPQASLDSLDSITSDASIVTTAIADKVSTKLSSFVNDATSIYEIEKNLYGYVKSKLSTEAASSTLSVISNVFTSATSADSLVQQFVSMIMIGEVPKVITSKTLPFVKFTTTKIITVVSSFTLQNALNVNQFIGDDSNKVELNITNIMRQYSGFSKPSGTSLVTYATNNKNDSYATSNPSSSGINEFKYFQSDKLVTLSDLTAPIQLGFSLNNYSKMMLSNGNYTISCRYWDETLNLWSSFGCSLGGIINGQASCLCTHTTKFSTFLEYKQQNLTQAEIYSVANVYYAQIAFGALFTIISITVLILLVIFRKKQPVASRLGTPYLGMIALLIESVLIYIIQRGVLLDQLLGSNKQMWESELTAANYIGNITTIIVNTLNLTAIFSYVIQVVRFQMMKNLYELLSTRDDKKRNKQMRGIRWATSTISFVTSIVIFTLINLAYWILWVVLVRVNVITSETYTNIVSISYTVIIFLFSVMITLITVYDFISSSKRERMLQIRRSKILSSMTNLIESKQEKKGKEKLYAPLINLKKWMSEMDGPLYFRIEMLLYILCFVFMIIQQIIGLSSLQYRFKDESTFQKALLLDGISFIFEVLYTFTYILVFGGYPLLIMANFKIRTWWKTRKSENEEVTVYESNTEMNVTLEDEKGYRLFEEYCEKEFSTENLLLYVFLKENTAITSGSDIAGLSHFLLVLHENYIKDNAPSEVNIPAETKKLFRALMQVAQQQKGTELEEKNSVSEFKKQIQKTFENLFLHISMNLEDTFSRFVFSPIYEEHLKTREIRQDIIRQANISSSFPEYLPPAETTL